MNLDWHQTFNRAETWLWVGVAVFLLVSGAIVLAKDLGVSDTLVGLTIVAALMVLVEQKEKPCESLSSPPDAADGVALAYRRQLALYRALLQRIYPGRRVRAFLLWTAAPRLMEIAAETLDKSMPYAATP